MPSLLFGRNVGGPARLRSGHRRLISIPEDEYNDYESDMSSPMLMRPKLRSLKASKRSGGGNLIGIGGKVGHSNSTQQQKYQLKSQQQNQQPGSRPSSPKNLFFNLTRNHNRGGDKSDQSSTSQFSSSQPMTVPKTSLYSVLQDENSTPIVDDRNNNSNNSKNSMSKMVVLKTMRRGRGRGRTGNNNRGGGTGNNSHNGDSISGYSTDDVSQSEAEAAADHAHRVYSAPMWPKHSPASPSLPGDRRYKSIQPTVLKSGGDEGRDCEPDERRKGEGSDGNEEEVHYKERQPSSAERLAGAGGDDHSACSTLDGIRDILGEYESPMARRMDGYGGNERPAGIQPEHEGHEHEGENTEETDTEAVETLRSVMSAPPAMTSTRYIDLRYVQDARLDEGGDCMRKKLRKKNMKVFEGDDLEEEEMEGEEDIDPDVYSLLAADGSYTSVDESFVEESEPPELLKATEVLEVTRDRSFSLSDISSASEDDSPLAVVVGMMDAVGEILKETAKAKSGHLIEWLE